MNYFSTTEMNITTSFLDTMNTFRVIINTNEIYFNIFFGIFVLLIIYFFTDVLFRVTKEPQKPTENIQESIDNNETPSKVIDNIESDVVDFKAAEDVLNFLNKLIHEKFNFYLYSELLPLYQKNKIPENSIITEIKNNIYISITASITSNMKLEILKFFTRKGIEMYIHEKIMLLINKIDYGQAGANKNFNEINQNNIHQIL